MEKVFPDHLLPVYHRADVAFLYGEGPYLFAANGRRYLDFVAGIAVSSLGHNHPYLSGALKSQVDRLLHVSNLYRVPEQERLARRLCENSFAHSVYFCNSGAESIEGAIKMARRTHFGEGNESRNRIITMQQAFHGRTMGALAATGNPKYLEGFGPTPGGFDQVEANSVDAVAGAISARTAAVMFEPVLAEGGILPISGQVFGEIRKLCDRHDLLLIVDEVQTGICRTGRLFGHQWADARPDIMTLAKGLGGGVPIGAICVSERVAKHMIPGTHGSTFSGNPLAMSAGNAVLDVVLAPGFIAGVERVSKHLFARGSALIEEFPHLFKETRGRGLLFGLKCQVPNADLVAAAFDAGLLCHIAGDNVLRLLPPLIVTEDHVNEAFEILRSVASVYEIKAGEV